MGNRRAQASRMICRFLLLTCVCTLFVRPARAQSGDRDFLSPAEADKVRNAQSPDARVQLFVFFAEDRMKKLQYELSSKEATQNRDMLLNGLLNGYSSCLDEATDRLQEAKGKGADMRSAVKEMQKQTKLFLDALHKIRDADGTDVESFKDSLSDAIDSTQDALNQANKASKEYGAVPVRRKP